MSSAQRNSVDHLSDVLVVGVIFTWAIFFVSLLGMGPKAEAQTDTPPPREDSFLEPEAVVETPEQALSMAIAQAPPVEALLWQEVSVQWRQISRDLQGRTPLCGRQSALLKQAAAASDWPAALLGGVAMVESACTSVSGGWMQIGLVSPDVLREAKQQLSTKKLSMTKYPVHALVTGAMVLQDLEQQLGGREEAILAYHLGVSGMRAQVGRWQSYATAHNRLSASARTYLTRVLASALYIQAGWEGEVRGPRPGDQARMTLGRWL